MGGWPEIAQLLIVLAFLLTVVIQISGQPFYSKKYEFDHKGLSLIKHQTVFLMRGEERFQ
jgi:hypothetical protein